MARKGSFVPANFNAYQCIECTKQTIPLSDCCSAPRAQSAGSGTAAVS
jgi:hypothetical protein